VWKQTFVILGGLALATSLPIVALAVTTDRTPGLNATSVSASTVTDWGQTAEATPTMVRQQLRVHAETGPPEGFEPVRQQLHRNEAQAVGPQDSPGRFQWADDAERPGFGATDSTIGRGQGNPSIGNRQAHACENPEECAYDGNPGLAGQQGRYGQGTGSDG
jgi:hypothetical protein